MEKRVYSLGDWIELEKACITEFWQVDDWTVEVKIEPRPYNTVYRMKRVYTNRIYHNENRNFYFIQVLRANRKF